MASQSSKDDEVTSKLQEVSTTTHIDGKIIKQTIEELKKIFPKVDKVYVILGVETTTDPDILIADMVVLNSDPNPFVYPPLPSFNHLICNTPLPQGYVLYVGLQGTQKFYVYQVPNSSRALTSPYLEFPGGSQGIVPCKDPTDEPPDEFLWDQEGPDDDYQIFKEENNTKIYWQYNGDGEVVTFNENNAQALVASLNVIANSLMASQSSKDVKVTSKPQEVSTTHIDGKVIKQTIRELKKIFGKEVKVYVILGVDTTTDSDILIADLVVLNSYPNPFVYPPLPSFNHLICNTPLPQGYILYVALQETQKSYTYQVPYHSLALTSPYLEFPGGFQGIVPCKDPRNEPPDEFLWDQEGPDFNYQIFKEENNTKLYWQYNGDGEIVTFTENNAQALSARLHVFANTIMASKSSKDVKVTSKPQEVIPAEVINTYIDGDLIKQTIAKLKQYFGQNVEVYVVLGDHKITDPDIQIADMRILKSFSNPFLFPTPTLDHLTFETTLPGEYILYVVQENKTARKAFIYQNTKLNKICGPCFEPTNKDRDSMQCKIVPFDPKSPKIPPEIFLWNQEGTNDAVKIYKEKTGEDKTKLYWHYNAMKGIVTFSKHPEFGLSAKLIFNPEQTPKMN